MSVKIRLSRGGAKKRPYYYIVVANSASPRDGRYIEQIGTFNPMVPKDSAERVKIDLDRDEKWDEKWTIAADGSIEREVAPADDEQYSEKYQRTGTEWVRR